MLYHEHKAHKEGYRIVIGVDEAGRGPLAGPVVAAAVFLKDFRFKNRIDDSKKLSASARQAAFLEIAQKAVFGVGVMNEAVVDAVNIACAANLAAELAVEKVLKRLSRRDKILLLCDGRLRPGLDISAKEIIGGDGKSLSIACASIVAKVLRDRLMDIYGRLWPRYGFSAHKGYGTRQHAENIVRFGLSPIHRRTFCGNIHGIAD